MERLSFRHHDRLFVFPLEGRCFVLGSGRDVDLRLPVPEVSRRHAELRREPEGWLLRDLGSRNGVFVHGRRVEEVVLPPRVEFTLGPVLGLIDEVSDSDAEAGLRLHGISGDPGDDSVITEEDGNAWGLSLAHRLVAPLARDLRLGEGPAVLARRGGELLAAFFPGLGIRIAVGGAVLFAAGELDEDCRKLRGPKTLAADRLTAHWQPPPSTDGFALKEAVELVTTLAAAAGDTAPAAVPEVLEEAGPTPSSMVAASPPMRGLLAYAHRVAAAPIHLLVLGPSGTGKELLAREIHAASPRRDGPFVALNCAALPRDLLEAELFGIEEKVATGVAQRPGHFEQADGGTLLLDEVCDMALETQAAMLRVLQEKSFYRVGGKQVRRVDVRLLASTNKDMAGEIEAGRFRTDLYYRLAGDTLVLPPLAERPGDVPLLIYHFLERFAREMGRPVAGISKKALDLMIRHSWPGNVRELENEVRRLVALSPERGLVEASHLSPTIRDGRAPGSLPAAGGTLVERLEAVERRLIQEALAAEDGNLTAAARRLGISRPGLYQRLERLGIGGAARALR